VQPLYIRFGADSAPLWLNTLRHFTPRARVYKNSLKREPRL
jgi:hypothetical protein